MLDIYKLSLKREKTWLPNQVQQLNASLIIAGALRQGKILCGVVNSQVKFRLDVRST